MKGHQSTRGRRKSDQLIRETMRFHYTLLELLEGKEGQFSPVLHRVQRLSNELGRRGEDRKLGKVYARGLERLASRLVEIGLIEHLPRKVRLEKIYGKMNERFPVGTVRIGWERDLPRAEKCYRLYMEDGRIFRTGKILEYGINYFRTANSVYKIDNITEEPVKSRHHGKAVIELSSRLNKPPENNTPPSSDARSRPNAHPAYVTCAPACARGNRSSETVFASRGPVL
jgi:hypothetical protein